MNVLLIEDDEQTARGIELMLLALGHQHNWVSRGEAGAALALRGTYDVVLLDVMLPGISGLEVAQSLRQTGRIEPIVMISAKDRTADAIAGLDAGADDYVTKPFDLDEVLARVRGALRRQVWGRAFPNSHVPEALEFGPWRIDFQTFLAWTRS